MIVMKHIIGIVMAISFFTAIFIFLWRTDSLRAAVWVFVSVFFMTAFLILAAYLVGSDA